MIRDRQDWCISASAPGVFGPTGSGCGVNVITRETIESVKRNRGKEGTKRMVVSGICRRISNAPTAAAAISTREKDVWFDSGSHGTVF